MNTDLTNCSKFSPSFSMHDCRRRITSIWLAAEMCSLWISAQSFTIVCLNCTKFERKCVKPYDSRRKIQWFKLKYLLVVILSMPWLRGQNDLKKSVYRNFVLKTPVAIFKNASCIAYTPFENIKLKIVKKNVYLNIPYFLSKITYQSKVTELKYFVLPLKENILYTIYKLINNL
jgi:hypothetical protein